MPMGFFLYTKDLSVVTLRFSHDIYSVSACQCSIHPENWSHLGSMTEEKPLKETSHKMGINWIQTLKLKIVAQVLALLEENQKKINLGRTVTAQKIVFSRTFLGQNYHFPGQSIQDLKVINLDMCEKAYNIYSMYDWLLTFLW